MPAAAAISGSQFGLLALVVAATTLMLISGRRRRREGGPSPRLYAREQLTRLKEERVVHDELSDVMTQLQLVAREISAQLDAKFIRLERSVRDADKRIERLARLTEEHDGDEAGLVDVTVDDAGATGAERDSPAEGKDDRREIYALADAGKNAIEIAQAVGSSAGEVELVLALRRSGGGLPVTGTA